MNFLDFSYIVRFSDDGGFFAYSSDNKKLKDDKKYLEFVTARLCIVSRSMEYRPIAAFF